MESILHYRIIVRGIVQGVGFRRNAFREAERLGIKGVVKNMWDGSVCIEAEGNRNTLEEFAEWCRRGPVFSSVDTVEIESLPPEGYNDFRISH
jgi:acylphosphatase